MDNKKRNILLGVLIVGVISMTVAFAALSTTLSINGTASLPATSWNIHFDNGVDNTSGTHANGKTNRGTITGLQFAATSISNFTATLYQPNDEVVYNFDIVNEGTIAGQLDNFTKTLTCNSASCDMITYTITCEDASHNDANQSDYILASGASVSCEMKIKYNDQTNSNNGVYSQGAVSATATATWLYKQVEGSGNSGNQGGNETPVANWNKYYYKDDVNEITGEVNTFDNSWNIWGQENTSTGEYELCGKYNGNIHCLRHITYDEFYDSIIEDNGNYSLKNNNYIADKAQEFLDDNLEISAFDDDGITFTDSNNTISFSINMHSEEIDIYDDYTDCSLDYDYSYGYSVYCH